MKKIILAGGNGFLGRVLAAELEKRQGYDVVILTRNPNPTDSGRSVRQIQWDGKTVGAWASELEGAEAIVNFTGRNVNCRYHAKNRRAILESRVDSVRAIDAAILRCSVPPKVLIQAATLAIVGNTGDTPLDESATPGVGFSPDVAKAWESTFNETPTPATRRVLLRISFALGPNGGALTTLATLTRCFLGGTVGTGRQCISWIHVADLTRLILWAIDNEHAQGLYNATAPEPVTNATFMRELRRALHRPWSPPAPAWAVRFGTMILRTEPELALWGRRGVPKRLIDEGFEFVFPKLPDALDKIYPAKSQGGERR